MSFPEDKAHGPTRIGSRVLWYNVLRSNVLRSNVLRSNVLRSNVLRSNVLRSNVLWYNVLWEIVPASSHWRETSLVSQPTSPSEVP